MRSTRATAAVAVLAVVGLVVSLAAAWAGLSTGATIQVEQSGPPAAARAPAMPRQEPAQAVVLGGARPAAIGRSDATAVRRALRAVRQERTSRPVRARLGTVDIDARVRPVGVRADGQMRLPDNPAVLGWYRFGAAPGSPAGGSTVLAGHLDARRFGLGPLVRLRDMAVGDRLRVGVADGSTTAYVVTSLRRYDRQGLPAELFSRTGPERLHVITCGGAYVPGDGYQLNLVVSAVPER